MKRLLAIMLLALLLSACGASSTPSEDAPAPPTEATMDQPEIAPDQPASADNQLDLKPVEAPAEETPFDKFQRGLDDEGYTYEVVRMAAELVGASAGVKYELDFGKVELYQFEDGSEALASAVSDGGLFLEGFGVLPCDFNGNLAALIDVTENKNAILDLFNSL